MHDTALTIVGRFFEVYGRAGDTVVELGSYDFNGSIRSIAPADARYIGLDANLGPGVDRVAPPGEPFPLDDASADLVVSSSMFEHDPAFWETFAEMLRVLKPGGLVYMNAPSNGYFHQYPQDCWRFYPDAGLALERWGRRGGGEVALVESFVADREADDWNDFVAVFVKGAAVAPPGGLFLSDTIACRNVRRFDCEGLLRHNGLSEDMEIIARLSAAPAAPSAAAEPGAPVRGSLDCFADGDLCGWAFDPADPARIITVALTIAGAPAGTTRAARYRADLAAAGIGDGRHAFALTVAPGFRDGDEHPIELYDEVGTLLATLTVLLPAG